MPKKKSRPQSTRTLGPLSDLERHLPPDWWRRLFNAVYLQTDADIVGDQTVTAREVDRLVELLNLSPGDRVLDLCCGQGRHALELARRGFTSISGIDRSRYLIRHAKRTARKEGLSISFHEGDARKLRFSAQQFDVVMLLGNSFGFFEQSSEDELVLSEALRILTPGGTVVLDLADGDWLREHFERRSWEWIDENQFVCRERSLSSDGTRIVAREVMVHADVGVVADQFYAERLYTKDVLLRLLKRAGFENVQEMEPFEGADASGDPGVMARRILLTAQTSATSVEKKAPAVLFPEVTVLLGDHSLPDTVKRGGKYNEEDFETLQKLEAALGGLDGRSFSFFDDHERMIEALSNELPEFVLNLCDEGYRNDAYKELHVPAFLEMIGVIYTGAGPACLGLCYNKSLIRSMALAVDVPVPAETYIDPSDMAATIPSILPAFMKPNTGDSSIGITKDAVVYTSEELVAYLKDLRDKLPGRAVLIQEYLTGPEYSVGIVGNPGVGMTYLPILEVDYSALDPSLPPILGYESKWLPDSPYWNKVEYKQADIDDETRRRLQDYSSIMFERTECRDYARFDFRADGEGVIKLLEVNPNPGWCWDGKMNLMAEFVDMTYTDLLEAILQAAEDRVRVERRRPAEKATA